MANVSASDDEVVRLLAAPDDEEVTRYFAKLLEGNPFVELRVDAGDGKGKGLFVLRNVEEGTTIFEESPLVAGQHSVNKRDCQCCGHCFQFVGSVEAQMAHKLLKLVIQLQDDSCAPDLRKRAAKIDRVVGPQGAHLRSLRDGGVSLPHSSDVELPAPVPCKGGCGELYCCEECATNAWKQYHCLLCPGPPAPANVIWKLVLGALGNPDEELEDPSVSSVESTMPEVPFALHVDRQAVRMFQDHADETNDIFLVAGTLIAKTLIKAHELLQQQQPMESSGEHSEEQCWHALLAASMCWRVGWKKPWWESVALPDDVEDEAEFRDGLEATARDSLDLLRSAIYDPNFPVLFSLKVFGSLVGMFELNNLDLEIVSPVGDYFCSIEDLPTSEQRVAARLTKPLMEALGPDCDTPFQGTAFMPLQSCLNHSCIPNCTAVWGSDATASIIATTDLVAGQQLEMSYVDEELDTSERQAALRDYGFTCSCLKCTSCN